MVLNRFRAEGRPQSLQRAGLFPERPSGVCAGTANPGCEPRWQPNDGQTATNRINRPTTTWGRLGLVASGVLLEHFAQAADRARIRRRILVRVAALPFRLRAGLALR